MFDACLEQLGADRKAICVQPPISHPAGNSNQRGRKLPVGCRIRSMLLFAKSPQFSHSDKLGRGGRALKNVWSSPTASWMDG